MRLTISHKLVFAFLGLTVSVLVATLGLARWSFDRGFLDYVNALEQNRLAAMRDELAQEYEASGGNWNSMTPRRFDAISGGVLTPPGDRSSNDGLSHPPHSGRPPGPLRGRPGEQSPRARPPDQLGPPTALYDMQNRQIAGGYLDDPDGAYIRETVVVDGRPVGELRSEPKRQLSTPEDTAFSRQQLNMSWTIGLIALAIAAAFSLALSRGLLAPVKRMIAVVARLSSGDYAARLHEPRHDELGQLMADLDHLGSTLEGERTSRRRWLADVSHELRTPLTVLSGEIEALRDGVRNFGPDQLASLDQEVERLRYLVNDLYELSLSDVGGLRYSFVTMNLSECLSAAVDSARNRAADNGLRIGFDCPSLVFVRGDIKRLDQLFQNLLANSVAYTDSPGRIEATLSLRGGTAVVEICDTAPGVGLDECEQLFEPLFRQDTSRSRRTGGAGLGLAISRNIVEAHRGRIAATPSELGGLCMQIEIPAVDRETA